jgi:hypothetical protein
MQMPLIEPTGKKNNNKKVQVMQAIQKGKVEMFKGQTKKIGQEAKKFVLFALSLCALATVAPQDVLAQNQGNGGNQQQAMDSRYDSNKGASWDIRANYLRRSPAAQQAFDADKIQDQRSVGPGTVSHSSSGPVYMWPTTIPTAQSQVPSMRDTSITKNLFQTFGYPISDTQFQLIERYNQNRMLEQLFDPERAMWTSTATAGIGANAAANGMASFAVNQCFSAIDYCKQFLNNFTAEQGNIWHQILQQLFIPMALLLLLPGAVLAQVRAIIAQGSPVLVGGQEVHPFEGIMRSIVAIFLIPATFLVINYGIDVANSITFTIADEYSRMFGSDMYEDAKCAIIRAFPVNKKEWNSNAMGKTETPRFEGQGNWAWLEGFTLVTAKIDPCAGIEMSRVPDEEVVQAKNINRLLLNGVNDTTAATWNLSCAFQMAFLYYLWCMGPIAAALWVWPLYQMRMALSSWIMGVLTICFWSLFWNTVILLMACFRGVGDSGTIIMTALISLAVLSIKHAFSFSSLVSAAASEAGAIASKMAANAKGGAGGGGGNTGGAGNSAQPGSQQSGTRSHVASDGSNHAAAAIGAGQDGNAVGSSSIGNAAGNSPVGSDSSASAINNTGSNSNIGGANGNDNLTGNGSGNGGADGAAAAGLAGALAGAAGGHDGKGKSKDKDDKDGGDGGIGAPPGEGSKGGAGGGAVDIAGGAPPGEGGAGAGVGANNTLTGSLSLTGHMSGTVNHTGGGGGGGADGIRSGVGDIPLAGNQGQAGSTGANGLGTDMKSAVVGEGMTNATGSGLPFGDRGMTSDALFGHDGKVNAAADLSGGKTLDVSNAGPTPGLSTSGSADNQLQIPSNGSGKNDPGAASLTDPKTGQSFDNPAFLKAGADGQPIGGAGAALDTSRVGNIPPLTTEMANTPGASQAREAAVDMMAMSGKTYDQLSAAVANPGGAEAKAFQNDMNVNPGLLKAAVDGNYGAAVVASTGFGETATARAFSGSFDQAGMSTSMARQAETCMTPDAIRSASVDMNTSAGAQMFSNTESGTQAAAQYQQAVSSIGAQYDAGGNYHGGAHMTSSGAYVADSGNNYASGGNNNYTGGAVTAADYASNVGYNSNSGSVSSFTDGGFHRGSVDGGAGSLIAGSSTQGYSGSGGQTTGYTGDQASGYSSQASGYTGGEAGIGSIGASGSANWSTSGGAYGGSTDGGASGGGVFNTGAAPVSHLGASNTSNDGGGYANTGSAGGGSQPVIGNSGGDSGSVFNTGAAPISHVGNSGGDPGSVSSAPWSGAGYTANTGNASFSDPSGGFANTHNPGNAGGTYNAPASGGSVDYGASQSLGGVSGNSSGYQSSQAPSSGDVGYGTIGNAGTANWSGSAPASFNSDAGAGTGGGAVFNTGSAPINHGNISGSGGSATFDNGSAGSAPINYTGGGAANYTGGGSVNYTGGDAGASGGYSLPASGSANPGYGVASGGSGTVDAGGTGGAGSAISGGPIHTGGQAAFTGGSDASMSRPVVNDGSGSGSGSGSSSFTAALGSGYNVSSERAPDHHQAVQSGNGGEVRSAEAYPTNQASYPSQGSYGSSEVRSADAYPTQGNYGGGSENRSAEAYPSPGGYGGGAEARSVESRPVESRPAEGGSDYRVADAGWNVEQPTTPNSFTGDQGAGYGYEQAHRTETASNGSYQSDAVTGYIDQSRTSGYSNTTGSGGAANTSGNANPGNSGGSKMMAALGGAYGGAIARNNANNANKPVNKTPDAKPANAQPSSGGGKAQTPTPQSQSKDGAMGTTAKKSGESEDARRKRLKKQLEEQQFPPGHDGGTMDA